MIRRQEWERAARGALMVVGAWAFLNFLFTSSPPIDRQDPPPPVGACPADQIVDSSLLRGKSSRLIGSSTGFWFEQFLEINGTAKLFPGTREVSARGIYGATIPQIEGDLDNLLRHRNDWDVVEIYAGRVEANNLRGKNVSVDQLAALESRAFSNYRWLVRDVGERIRPGRVVGITNFLPPDGDESETWFVNAFNNDLVRESGQGYTVLDLRGCRVSFRDEIHPSDETLNKVLAPAIKWIVATGGQSFSPN